MGHIGILLALKGQIVTFIKKYSHTNDQNCLGLFL